jgi:hypothetical protein
MFSNDLGSSCGIDSAIFVKIRSFVVAIFRMVGVVVNMVGDINECLILVILNTSPLDSSFAFQT